MEIHQHQKNIEKYVKKQIEEEEKLMQENQQNQSLKQSSSPQPSTSTSPTHEFSFTISLNSSTTTTFLDDNSITTPSSLALDLSPADDIFFHGHLLPLHFLSHLSSSPPRFSTNSMDSFTLPITELSQDHNLTKDYSVNCSTSNRGNIIIDNNNNNIESNNIGTKGEEGDNKFKHAFSLFGLTKGQKGCQDRDKGDKENHKKKIKFNVIHALKKYIRIVLFKGGREKVRLHGKSQSYSYSGNVNPRNKQNLSDWRGQFSAPASMRTSPSNSGFLLATTTLPPASDSSMEELQAAIQAAIAHCKSSIAKEENLKC
ncbi:hypothetical protein Lal_00010122 [Lupinus albus]|uniref:Putative WD40/YVTN repeat-like-containing domain-containing protein n=1 Tax=Lupinus albus TaxID=3870 RepID=A0A6A4N817_LUPAL|nr:putative WD40/YVTN repeat-like-containing domain-containing protein [Lupinus albus]KAF1859538.1 hypothetical protein Lal_00010122 [Lupinus albus]